MSGPYREPVGLLHHCGNCKRPMSPLNNSRRWGDKTVCMPCAEALRLIPEVRASVRSLFALLTAEQRVAVAREWFVGYCRACGVELKGRDCSCQKDE